MRRGRARATGVAGLVLLLASLTGCEGQTLRIFPIQKHQPVAVGKSVVLTCQVDAPDPALVSQPMWRDPKGNIINEALYGLRPEIFTESMPAKQSQLLYISSITRSMAGNYTCIATYTNTPLRASVVLETFVAITWTNANENQSGIKGMDYKVMCEVTAEPPPSVDWFKESTPIVTGDRYVIHTNGLLIKNVRESDDGTYTCRAVVMQTGELAERSIKLEVLSAPEMEERELSVAIKEGETATITCQAHGIPPPKYTWVRDSTKENLLQSPRFFVDENKGLLRFEKIEAGDYGKYTCHASNAAGQNSSSFEVEVLVPPKIFELFNTTAAEGTEGLLECKATGRPTPHITFRKLSNFMPFREGPNDKTRIAVQLMSRQAGDQMETTGILSITQLTRKDDGLYECVARSGDSEARKNGHMTVQFKPTFESMSRFPVWTWNFQPVNISCLAESIPNATIKWKYHDYDLVESPHVRIYGSGPFSYITITPGDRSVFGNYKCIATNTLGEAVHIIQLREAFPPGPIPQISTGNITATTVSFGIVGPGEDMGPPILAYTVQYKETGGSDWTYALKKTWSANSPYIVEDLAPMTHYDFRFAAVNEVGVGSWGATKGVITLRRSSPEVPMWRENVTPGNLIYGKFPDRYELKWKIPANNGEPIDMYEIAICQINKVSGDWRVMSECRTEELKYYDEVSYEVSGLRPDTRYRLSVRAHNVLGYSDPAQLIVQTATGVDYTGFTTEHMLSSGAIIGLALAAVLICLIVVDLILYCWKRTGVFASLCCKRNKHPKEDESKLGRDEKEPLKETGEDMTKSHSMVEFDGHRVYATTGGSIIGKNSAV